MGGDPLVDVNGDEVFCGRGPNRQTCPDTHRCHIEPADGFAACCKLGMIMSNILYIHYTLHYTHYIPI